MTAVCAEAVSFAQRENPEIRDKLNVSVNGTPATLPLNQVVVFI